MLNLNNILESISGFLWNYPVLWLILGGGLFFTLFSRLIPFRYLLHSLNILRGKYDSESDPGQITHFQALSSALASTVGMGNIAGVAVAIHTGGPGAIFWMWVSAVIGMATKFFTCTLAVMYRGKDDSGEIQGGPMYFIEVGLGKKFKPLAIFFSIAGLFGCLTFFQANQLSQLIRDFLYTPLELFSNNTSIANAVSGILMAAIVGLVVFGGIRRIAQVASRLVPFMVTIYLLAAIMILLSHISEIPSLIRLIIHDAFTGEAVLGGAVGAVIATGIRRAAFSNEAGMGTEAMAHGAAKTKEPVREGLVAMLGPLIDTIIVCSVTALVILTSGMWQAGFQSAEKVTIPAGSESVNLRIDDIKELSSPNKKWVGLEFTISKELNNATVINDTIEIISVVDKETLLCKNLGNKDINVVKDSWFQLEENGVTLTTLAFDKELGVAGKILIIIAVLTFSLSTMFGYSYYGRKCAGYLLGVRWKPAYNWVYVLAIVVASMVKIDLAINFVDSMFALMAIPTVISTLILAPKVMQAARKYFRQLES
ncbi:MAG: sodium:alanine symporter family protein [Candidatus Marinimicrobia bacterium]|jgi:AGCS family alanine or glycine:cation symporter|nr:sodium:alanine symporter family protein [Candidatus Neomarinimicrobiota bacterium]MDP7026543.1 sodium:alanine symporter family protein [Candidatus Neomarinimicrobiota bacterium]